MNGSVNTENLGNDWAGWGGPQRQLGNSYFHAGFAGPLRPNAMTGQGMDGSPYLGRLGRPDEPELPAEYRALHSGSFMDMERLRRMMMMRRFMPDNFAY